MNIKSLMTTSVIALISASAVQAADVIIPHESAPVITAPTFSWTGFYLGAQVGGLITNSKRDDNALRRDVKLSGMVGGLYAGYNVDLGSGVVFGFDTDVVLAGKKDIKTVSGKTGDNTASVPEEDKNKDKNEGKETVSVRAQDNAEVSVSEGVSFKQKWSGATRARIGLATADRIMPYVAGGVAYTQLEAVYGTMKKDSSSSKYSVSSSTSSETATMVGFTIGGGIDFAMTDNVLLRAEYRYSDFGKKKFFGTQQKEYNFSTNDFRVGVAYKF